VKTAISGVIFPPRTANVTLLYNLRASWSGDQNPNSGTTQILAENQLSYG
jgi:hypothetical protein